MMIYILKVIKYKMDRILYFYTFNSKKNFEINI